MPGTAPGERLTMPVSGPTAALPGGVEAAWRTTRIFASLVHTLSGSRRNLCSTGTGSEVGAAPTAAGLIFFRRCFRGICRGPICEIGLGDRPAPQVGAHLSASLPRCACSRPNRLQHLSNRMRPLGPVSRLCVDQPASSEYTDGYLMKPIDFDALKTKLETMAR